MISLIGTFALVHGFSALLPPIPEEEVSYYEIMQVSPSASQDDIRKAYRKISLQLHPDKVAQRGGNAEQARSEYQKVQEAYGVLSNKNKRRRYDILHRSPTQYQFVSTGMNPGAMYENLSSANCCHKSRLVLMATMLCCILLLQPILICAKLNQDLSGQGGILASTPWVVVLIPWWLTYGLVVVAHLLVYCVSHQVLFAVAFLEHAAWFVGEVLLALRWDASIMWDYKIVFIPIYIALVLRWTHKYLRLQQIRSALQRMVSLDYLESEILPRGRRYQDLTEEEIHDICEKYVVVHVPPSVVSSTATEEEKVQASPEFEHAVDAYTELLNALIASILVSTSFVALVVAKVDGAIYVSWWIVFLPIWINIGVTLLASIYMCCCITTIGEEVIVVNNDDDETEQAEEEREDGYKDRDMDDDFADVEGSIRRDGSEQASVSKTDAVGSNKDSDVKSSTVDTPDKVEEQSEKRLQQEEKSKKGEDEESKEPDVVVVEELPTTGAEEPSIHIDEDMFHEFESAYQEAEESAMEAQAKSQADCCTALFQLMMLCLLVGKLQQDYMRGENESPGYNAFWILFPIFLIFGCALCSCACLIYTAGESEGIDHLVERVSMPSKEDGNEEDNSGTLPSPSRDEDNGGAAASKDEVANETTQEEPMKEAKNQPAAATEPVAEIDDLD